MGINCSGDRWANNWYPADILQCGTWFITMADYLSVTHPRTTVNNYPGNETFYSDGIPYAFWSKLVESGDTQAGLNYPGDILTYKTLEDGSSLGPSNVPIGNADQVLSIQNQEDIYYRDLYTTEVTVVYVAPDGVDDLETYRGIDVRIL